MITNKAHYHWMVIRENIIPNIDKMHSERSIENQKSSENQFEKKINLHIDIRGKTRPIQVLNNK